jgi:predicted transcriptional regulator
MRVLMSIKPEYVAKIFSGEKQWEYRKVRYKNPDINTIIMYASAPISKVVGEFEVNRFITCDTPNILWNLTGSWGGIPAEDFLDYFAYRKIGYAIRIGKVTRYDKPRPLSDYGIKRPPQNFMYLKEESDEG